MDKNTVKKINEDLRNAQKSWYEQLPEMYKADVYAPYNKFSSPFCCGVSEKEWNKNGKKIMFVGEEPRGWWFDYCDHRHGDVEYLQKYSIEYFERQCDIKHFDPESNELHKEYQCKNSNKCPCKSDPEIKSNYICNCENPFKNKNSSPFWKFINSLREKGYSVCWNNVDKLHAVEYVLRGNDRTRETKVLTAEQESDLHRPLAEIGRTLLLEEIRVVSPDFVIFLGKAYGNSIRESLMLEDGPADPAPELKSEKTVVKINSGCAKKVLWMCHPASLNRSGRGLFEPTVDLVLKLLSKE